ncbi:MAG: hypothetical protein VCF24_07390 [Candidatus Latescibacterota bacterium]
MRPRLLINTGVFTFLASASLLVSACGYHHHTGPLEPVSEQEASLTVADDGSVTYTQGRLEVKLRPVTAEELNRLFAGESAAGPKSTNPFTYGDTEFFLGKKNRQRFTVFNLSVKNYAYPKVVIEPARVQLVAGNGRKYWSLNVEQLDNYYRIYATGYRGNEYARYRARLDLLTRTLFQNGEIFSGQESEGYLVFQTLHPDVKQIEVVIHEAVLRFDYRGEPAETVDISYRFQRDIGRRYHDGTLELSAVD